MPRNRPDKGSRKTRTQQQKERHLRSQGMDADTSESVSMQGRDDENRVGGRNRRTLSGEPSEDTAEGGRQPARGKSMNMTEGRRRRRT